MLSSFTDYNFRAICLIKYKHGMNCSSDLRQIRLLNCRLKLQVNILRVLLCRRLYSLHSYMKKTEHNLLLIKFREIYWQRVLILEISKYTTDQIGSVIWGMSLLACFNTGIVRSNPTWGMDVCVRLFGVCVVLCVGSGLATGWSSV
jgi:hypothetical protein